MSTGPRSTAARAGVAAEGETLATLRALVPGLAAALGADAEVVLHDLRKLPRSIVAVAGEITARQVGDPPTDVLLRHLKKGRTEHLIGYSTQTADGRELRSSTLIFCGHDGTPIAALCINVDISDWVTARTLLAGVVDGYGTPPAREATEAPAAPVPAGRYRGEAFAHSVEELVSAMIEEAVAASEVPVSLMRKEHKLAVVRRLDERGLFLIRDSVEATAAALKVTRFTVYNYLNEISGAAPTRRRRRASD